jgi:hypothetical protein
MITLIFFGVLGAVCLLSLSDWRKGVYGAILLDFARDPVRKLDPTESVWITVSILALWGCIAFSVWYQSQSTIQRGLRSYPLLSKAIQYLIIAILPGIATSIALYQNGYRLAALGAVSYLAPFAGLMIGYVLSTRIEDVTRFMRFYCIVNGIALVGVLAEYLNLGWPALGGLRGMNWIRYSGSETVKLISGFYRSPDIMGLHAAQVAMFTMALVVFRPKRFDWKWLFFSGIACLCLVLSGRRKMLGMPLVMGGTFFLLSYWRGIRHVHSYIIPIASLGVVAGGFYLVLNDSFVSNEYLNYSKTLFTEGVQRSQDLIFTSIFMTLEQTGILGSGIGSATQGNYHILTANTTRGWQEDAFSRLFRELGLVGVIFIFGAVWSLAKVFRQSIRRTPISNRQNCIAQILLISIVIANLASFGISHQQFSGDPPSAIIVLILAGMALAIPNMVRMPQKANVMRTRLSMPLGKGGNPFKPSTRGFKEYS